MPTAIYDADLQGYYDSIPQDKLLACVRMRVADRSVLGLIRRWLEAPIREEKQRFNNDRGTPQGGVASPRLANLRATDLNRERIERRSNEFADLARLALGTAGSGLDTGLPAMEPRLGEPGAGHWSP